MASFKELGLNIDLINSLQKQHITIPTNIQTKVIPLALENKDIIAKSQTGTGKTLAYLLPIFHRINFEKKEMQCIILVPTHELAMQINSEIKLLSQNYSRDITSCSIIGNVNIARQIEKLKEKPHIIVGSSGRIFELIKKKKISSHTIKTIVIDECDKLLDKNNISKVKDIIKTTLRDRQLMAFSASINEETINSASSLMKEPSIIKIEDEILNTNVEHMYFLSDQREKFELLRKIIAAEEPKKSLIFINKPVEIEFIVSKLQYHHISSYALYGNAKKEERKKALNNFRAGKIQFLVASDIAARGLDVKDITHIFNLDLPEDPKEYLHRVGRTGRMNKSGITISIITKRDLPTIKKYMNKLNLKIKEKYIFKGKIIDKTK
ncbi:DEAD-box ATP-dependent RNA helicase CshA [Clostridium pasteurianum DSM 525 = ATCC 6013]|uniref:DEAD-box ATP-dependent RNA helicase CshA n=1 Tax=Clostridium pasteurianum DSM 525 = ATCC 6013 TaxID=1262449 RepID=A0A0H3J5S9_CLOPA|nr:DEAD/DEAH box helicase [Clostridium pasteurianum]AJA49366.1 DEAD-box ATP-dependent RNA helicase CshA [Clostridium pasteurianum DSM 525 = ATCC 6013]AJA53354.1 DEAD-box ATP-dependent RNA helicase CshA [Clostridium pasteurianum DSM 525 = ATCC 6013]AOZ76539.1 helicase [Clostridium pasteurianum DSM 525 = ATCC 6013]AOZ80336.1 helicase [Clostridium pasteurianum]ELP58386.1 DEAD/DEAH box family ATP-dependent RNA helicase [Clostridium pasteurianum DSM 525 = ATCC 6013]